MLGDSSIGVFDSKTYDAETYGIGPKISLLSGEFIRQFKLPPGEQKFYCYTSKEINTQAISNRTIYDDPQNIFELLSMLKEIELSLFDEYLKVWVLHFGHNSKNECVHRSPHLCLPNFDYS